MSGKDPRSTPGSQGGTGGYSYRVCIGFGLPNHGFDESKPSQSVSNRWCRKPIRLFLGAVCRGPTAIPFYLRVVRQTSLCVSCVYVCAVAGHGDPRGVPCSLSNNPYLQDVGGRMGFFYSVVTRSKHMCVCRRVRGMRCAGGRGLKLC